MGREKSDCRGSLKLVTRGSVTGQKFVCPTHSEAKQTEMLGVWSRERFIAGPCKKKGWLVPPKTPDALKGFSKAFLKARGVPGYVISSGTIL